mgnify:FL=1
MKHLLLLPVVCGALLLAGCAGVDGDFECNATTSDRCMTMGDANQKARQMSGDAAGKPAATALPALVNPPQQAPVATLPASASASLPSRPAVITATRPPVTPVRTAPLSQPAMPVVRAAPAVLPSCPVGRCDSPGQVRAQRSAENIAHVWVAPWVDADDVFHQPGRVSFVVNGAQWQLPQSIY